MTTDKEVEKLIAEFQQWVEQGVWQGENEFTKNFAVGNVADWWVEKFTTYKQQLREKIEEMKKVMMNGKEYELNNFSRQSYNQALSDILHLLENKEDSSTKEVWMTANAPYIKENSTRETTMSAPMDTIRLTSMSTSGIVSVRSLSKHSL